MNQNELADKLDVCKLLLQNHFLNAAAKDAGDAAAYLREQAEQMERAEPVAWGMADSDGVIVDSICPEEHRRHEGGYTIPLYAHAPAPADADYWHRIADERAAEIVRLTYASTDAVEALRRIELAVDLHLGRSAWTQTRGLKGTGYSEQVRKELYAAHDVVRAALAAADQKEPKCD